MKATKFLLLLSLLACVVPTFAETAGQVVDDTTLLAKVKSKLVSADFTSGFNVNVDISNGVVQLGGFIDDAAEGTKAANLAKSVDGVVAVDNQLHVSEGKVSMGQMLDDRVMSTSVKGKIADANLGTGISVNVDVHNGVVLLTGFVDDAATKSKVGELAKGTDNVKKVINGVHVLK